MATNPLMELSKHGQSFWFDSLRRGLIHSGELKRMIDEDGLGGITSNPTILDKAIAGSTDYVDAVQKLLEAGATPDDIYESLVLDDIRAAADVLRTVYDETEGADGFVSLEVSPALAHDTAGTVAQARHFFTAVNRPNLMVKVPATPEGMPAIRQLIGEGININVTLIFSLNAYRQVIDAYFGGLELLAKSGKPVNQVHSVASFFVSRVDTAVDKLLEAKIAQEKDPDRQDVLKGLLGTAAIANSKMAYQMFKEEHATPRFKALAEKGAHVQRVLWASTSTKNPAYSDTMYVEALVGPNTVDTMPPETVVAFRDHGTVTPGAIEQDVEAAKTALQALRAEGIDMNRVTAELLAAGVDSFAQSFVKLMHCITERREGYLTGIIQRQTFQLASHSALIEERLHALDEKQFGRRLWNEDLSLWSDDKLVQTRIKNRLGWLWLNPADDNRERLADVRNLAQNVKNAGFKDAVLLGMGGSSLAAEVLRQTFGHIEGYPKLHVLDTTDPTTILNLEKSLDLSRTLFIVSSKSGTTTETEESSRYFFDKVKAVKGQHAGENFIAITDPNTPLADVGHKNRFRGVYINPPDIGGRFSVLSYFGLAPAAVMGLDVESLLDRAERMAHSCAQCIVSAENPGISLGVVMGELAQKGHDKITLICSPQIESFGLWVEQLIAESTGKQGKGLVPVAGETVGRPLSYGSDRLFVYLRLQSSDNTKLDEQVREAGRRRPPGGNTEPDPRAGSGWRVLPLGDGHRGRRRTAAHQPIRRAERAGEQGQHPPGAERMGGGAQNSAADRHRRRRSAGDHGRRGHEVPAGVARS